jgi:uncharacterized protein YdhG (YjbR/CyaY superfamily)
VAPVGSVAEYVAGLPPDAAARLTDALDAARRAVPGAGDRISYGIPTITLDGAPIVHVAAWKQHLSLYPMPTGGDALLRELEPYAAGKGTLRFPLAEPVPLALIERTVAALLAERTRPTS